MLAEQEERFAVERVEELTHHTFPFNHVLVYSVGKPVAALCLLLLVDRGRPTGAAAGAAMAAREIELRLHLGGTGPWAEVRTSDLTPEYVRLNSEYTT